MTYIWRPTPPKIDTVLTLFWYFSCKRVWMFPYPFKYFCCYGPRNGNLGGICWDLEREVQCLPVEHCTWSIDSTQLIKKNVLCSFVPLLCSLERKSSMIFPQLKRVTSITKYIYFPSFLFCFCCPVLSNCPSVVVSNYFVCVHNGGKNLDNVCILFLQFRKYSYTLCFLIFSMTCEKAY